MSKKKRFNLGRLIGKLFTGIVLATIIVILTPSPEEDTGPPKVDINISTYIDKNKKYEEFVAYLTENSYIVKEDKLPLYIQVEKRQVDGSPEDIAKQLSKKGFEITGGKVKVILNTWGGKYIYEYTE
jgi:hypothetical protein